MTITNKDGLLTYVGDTFEVRITRYSDPERLNAARNAARYLGKKDLGNVRRPLRIIRDGHVAEIFRGEHVEFEFHDVSKEVYDHICTYTTRNMRVAGGNRALTSDDFTMPSDRMKDPWRVKQMIEESMNRYKTLLETGETPQVARAAMPVNAKMNTFVYQFNFLTLGQSFFRQRIWERGAQGNTVKVVRAMYELCKFIDAELWDTFYEWYGEPAAQWVEVRRKIKKEKVTVAQMFDLLSETKIEAENTDSIEEIGQMLFEDFLKEKFGNQKSMWD